MTEEIGRGHLDETGENRMMTNGEKNALKQAYNNTAERRDQSSMAPWKVEERQRFLDLLQLEGRRSQLEIGAGTGRDSLYFQEQGLSVTPVDFSEEMVGLCRRKGLPARIMDFGQLDFPAESFDAVYAMNCLLHVPKAELDGVLGEIRKVLKPGGLFFCGLYGGQSSEGVWENDSYEPKRFFSMYEDDEIVKIMARRFEVDDYHTVDMGAGAPHFQSITMRKTADSMV